MARFTEEQQAAIDAQGKTIVSASAGSGKTTVMIEKIIRLIKSGVGVDEILAVTFTKKAAAQMKEKLGKALIESINDPETPAEKRAALKKQLSDVPNADISTIHSFCSKLIRSHFFAAGVDNAFRVIGGDDAEGVALKAEALDELLEEGYENKEERFAHLLSVYWRKKSDNTLRKIFTSAYEKLRNSAEYRNYLRLPEGYNEEIFDQICEDLLKKLWEKCRYYYDLIENEKAYFEMNGGDAQIALATELLGCLDEMLACKTYFEACALLKPKFTAKRTSKKDSPERLSHVERLAYLKGKVAKIYEDELAETLSREEELDNFLKSAETARALAHYLLVFDEKYAALKAERGVLDYNDLEHTALQLLANEEVATEVRGKYRYVFVDEYQDVNPVQEAIISRLGGDNLFLVGDVKQSIYGFRGSKSKFFAEKQKQFEEIGQSLFMTRNFRSADAVLDAVNSQFILAMTPQVCDVDYARGSYMNRGGRYALNSGKVEIHVYGKEEKKAAEARGVYSVKAKTKKEETSVSLLAKNVKNIIDKELHSTWYDPDTGTNRPVRYADIAVLSRKKQGQIAKTVAALAAEGIPVTSVAAVNVCDYAEIKTLIDVLSLLDNAEQDVPLCSALLSPVGDLSADDLTEIRLAYTEEKFFRRACKMYADEQENALSKKLQAFYAYFDKLRAFSRVATAGEVLTALLSETRLEATLLAKDNGVACLKRIHRFIEETALPEPLGVHAFLARLRDLDYTIEYNENGGEDSVKVLTMHSSKGLEYPVVIVDNLNALFRGADKDEVLIEEKYGLAPKAFNAEKMTKHSTLLRRLNELKDSESSIADELNLYYVALTRAKHTLHMLFESRPSIANVKYAKSFAEFTDFSVWEQYVVDDEWFDVPKQDRQMLPFKPDEELAQEIMRSFTWKYAHTGYENLPVKSSASDLISDGGFKHNYSFKTENDGGRYELNDFGTPMDEAEKLFEGGELPTDIERRRGIVYHAFLERFDFSKLTDTTGVLIPEGALKTMAQSLCEEMNAEGVADADLLSVDKLVEILSNPVFAELKDMQLYKEQQFTVLLPVKDTYARKKTADPALAEKTDGEEMLFQGAIDLLAVGDTIRIIDYKYSKKDAAYLKEHYRLQLDLYKKTVAKILKTEEKNIRCSIVNICQGYQIDME